MISNCEAAWRPMGPDADDNRRIAGSRMGSCRRAASRSSCNAAMETHGGLYCSPTFSNCGVTNNVPMATKSMRL